MTPSDPPVIDRSPEVDLLEEVLDTWRAPNEAAFRKVHKALYGVEMCDGGAWAPHPTDAARLLGEAIDRGWVTPGSVSSQSDDPWLAWVRKLTGALGAEGVETGWVMVKRLSQHGIIEAWPEQASEHEHGPECFVEIPVRRSSLERQAGLL